MSCALDFYTGIFSNASGSILDQQVLNCQDYALDLQTDFMNASDLFFKGQYEEASIKVDQIIRGVPKTFKECTALKSGIDAVKAVTVEGDAPAWDEARFAENKDEIETKWAEAVIAWGSDECMASGEKIMEVYRMTFGQADAPEEPELLNLLQAPTKAYVAEMIATFFAELVYLNRLTGISDCAVDSEGAVRAGIKVIEDVMNGDQVKALTDGIKAQAEIRDALSFCATTAPGDLAAMLNWFDTKVSSRQAMVDATGPNAHAHAKEIQDHVEEVWDVFFKMEFPVQTGQALGRVAYWALGPVEPISSIEQFAQ